MQALAEPGTNTRPPWLDETLKSLVASDPKAQPAELDDPFDPIAIAKHFGDEIHASVTDGRSVWERLWWRNILYCLGRHWIYWDESVGRWMDRRLARWVPRPVVPKVEEGVETLLALFESIRLQTIARPRTNDPAHIMTAELVDTLEPVIQEDHDIVRAWRLADFWAITTGNALIHPHYDFSVQYGISVVPFTRCLACGEVHSPADVTDAGHLCPACGSDELADDKPVAFPQGRGKTAVFSPLEFGVPQDVTDFKESPRVVLFRFRSKRFAEQHYPADVVAKIQWQKDSSERTLQLARAIASHAEVSTQPQISEYESSEQEGITEYEWWEKPCKEYPDGLVARLVEVGDGYECVSLPGEDAPGPLPIQTPQGMYVFPFIHQVYTRFANRFWGRSPLDRCIPIQDAINRLESQQELITQRMANPVWMHQRGAEVKRFTGEPGLVIEYNATVQGGKPERIEGANIPASLSRRYELKVAEFESALGTNDVLKGQKPTGADAFATLQLLVERSQGRFGVAFAERGEAYQQWYRIALEYERALGPESRTLTLMLPNSQWTFTTYQRADLMGDIDLKVEDGTQAPKTNLGKRAAIQQLTTMQAIDAMNPETQYEILTTFGQRNLLPGLDVQVQGALYQQDQLARWASDLSRSSKQLVPGPPMVDPMTGQPMVDPSTGIPVAGEPVEDWIEPPPIEPQIEHDPNVHIAQHTKWLNSDQARQLMRERPELREVFTQLIAVDIGVQQMLAAGMNPWVPPVPPPPMPGDGTQEAPDAQGGARALQNSIEQTDNPDDVPSGSRDDVVMGRGPE